MLRMWLGDLDQNSLSVLLGADFVVAGDWMFLALSAMGNIHPHPVGYLMANIEAQLLPQAAKSRGTTLSVRLSCDSFKEVTYIRQFCVFLPLGIRTMQWRFMFLTSGICKLELVYLDDAKRDLQ
jgi:hypothetical protein